MIGNYLKPVFYFVLALLISFICLILIPRNKLVVKDQNKGQAIHISEVSLTQGGFIVIATLNPETNFPDEFDLLNNPVYLPAGKYKNINIVLNEHALDSINRISVSLYVDINKNGYFAADIEDNSNLDIHATTFSGEIIRNIIDVY